MSIYVHDSWGVSKESSVGDLLGGLYVLLGTRMLFSLLFQLDLFQLQDFQVCNVISLTFCIYSSISFLICTCVARSSSEPCNAYTWASLSINCKVRIRQLQSDERRTSLNHWSFSFAPGVALDQKIDSETFQRTFFRNLVSQTERDLKPDDSRRLEVLHKEYCLRSASHIRP